MKDELLKVATTLLEGEFSLNSWVVLIIISAVSMVFGFAGSWIQKSVSNAWKKRRYGGWVIEVRNGSSGRNWHAPVDLDIIEKLKKQEYTGFKRDLGTLLSGERQLKFTFGGPITEPLSSKEPIADGLVIDHEKKLILVDCQPEAAVQDQAAKPLESTNGAAPADSSAQGANAQDYSTPPSVNFGGERVDQRGDVHIAAAQDHAYAQPFRIESAAQQRGERHGA